MLTTEVDDRFVFGRVRNHEITFESLLPFPFCPWFPFFSISSSVFLPSLFHSFTFICSFHRLYFFLAYLLCYKHHDILTPPCHFPLMLSHFLSLVLYLSFYSSVCPALSRYLCSAEAGKWRSLRLRRCSSPVSPVPPCTNLRELKY